MGSFNLKSYQDRYAEILWRRFPGKNYDPRRLDPLGDELRSGCRLEFRHVEKLFDDNNSHFGQFWNPPSDLDEKLKAQQVKVQLRPGHRGSLVSSLFGILGSIDTTSILLRCVYPGEFGVYSPPTLNLLQLPQLELKRPVDHYLHYCDELRVWGGKFTIEEGSRTSVGETEKALWVFYEDAYGPKRDKNNAAHRQKEFTEDEWIRERRTQNFLKPFFKDFKPLEQARLLSGIDPNLAGKIAGCELESLVREATSGSDDTPRNINDFVKKYPARGLRKELHNAWNLRCDAIHNLKALTGDQAQQIIKAVDRVQKALAP